MILQKYKKIGAKKKAHKICFNESEVYIIFISLLAVHSKKKF